MKKPKIVQEEYDPESRLVTITFENGMTVGIDIDVATKKAVLDEWVFYKAMRHVHKHWH